MNQNKCLNPLVKSIGVNENMTPDIVVNKMLDAVEKHSADIFKDPNKTFLNIYSKVGEFEIELYNRLDEGLKNIIIDDEERKQHIITKQIHSLVFKKSLMLLSSSNIKRMLDLDASTPINAAKVAVNDVRDRNWKEIYNKMNEEYTNNSIDLDGLPKFDVVVGNPPYQDEDDWPLYHHFIELGKAFGNISTMITPARYLFNTGRTPKVWNEEVLNDPHFSIVHYEQLAMNLFPGALINGGVAISLYDKNKEVGPVGLFTINPMLDSLAKKVGDKSPLSTLLTSVGHFSNEVKKNKGEDLKGAAFTTSSELFSKTETESSVKVHGLLNAARTTMNIDKKFIEDDSALNSYNVLISRAYGSPLIGEKEDTLVIGAPIVSKVGETCTSTFFALGEFQTEQEAVNLANYLRTKFARALFAITKTTQHISQNTFRYVQNQDFSESSDIDWTVSLDEIDNQLFKKYKLTEDEINFITKNIRKQDK